METVTCSCRKYSRQVGELLNLWLKIGKAYLDPVAGITEQESIQIQEKVRNGADSETVAGSFLQSLSCKECFTLMGIECESTPEGYVLKSRDQLLLRLGGLSMVSDLTCNRGVPEVQDSISVQRESHVTYLEIADNSRVGELEGRHAVETLPPNSGDVEPRSQFAEWIESFKVQRRDIDRISGAVARIDREMQNFKDFISTIRSEIASRPKKTELDQLGQDLYGVAGGLENLRQDFKQQKLDDDRFRINVDEMDVLIGSISTLGQKVNEVDILKVEIQFLKARLKRVEDDSRNIIASTESMAENAPSRRPTVQYSSPLAQLAHQAILHLETPIESTPTTAAAKRKRNSVQYEERVSVPKRGRLTENPINTIISRKPTQNSKPRQGSDESSTHEDPDIDELSGPINLERLKTTAEPPAASNTPLGFPSPLTPRPAPTAESLPLPTHRAHRTKLPSHRHSSDSALKSNVQAPSSALTIEPATTSEQKSRPATRRSRRRAAASETLRNADGVRLTRKGLPDKRAGNYKYLKAYYEGLKKNKVEAETDEETESGIEVELEECDDEEEQEKRKGLKKEEMMKSNRAMLARESIVVQTLKRMERDEMDETDE